MTYTTGSPETSGPNRDGSRSLARESKLGNIANGLLVAGSLYLADALGDLNITPLPDALEPLVVAGVGVVVGLLTSYATKNRTTIPLRRRPE